MHRKWKQHPPYRLVAQRTVPHATPTESPAAVHRTTPSVRQPRIAPPAPGPKAWRGFNRHSSTLPEICLLALGFALALTSMATAADTDDTQDPTPSRFASSAFIADSASIERKNPLLPEYLLSTPQIIDDPLKPLLHLADAADDIAERVTVHAAVVSVADPLETHLGRAFDIQLSSLVRAFHTQDYVVDAFAFTWNPKYSGGKGIGKRIPEGGSTAYSGQQRRMPSVLLFRKDLWRERVPGPEKPIGAEYFIVFLVGESPTFGVQPEAFRKAAQCAVALNSTANDRSASQRNWFGERCSSAWEKINKNDSESVLQIIGPSFSGSMQSLALAVGSLINAHPELKVNIVSPSATVNSNERILEWASSITSTVNHVRYRALGASLEDQMHSLCDYYYSAFPALAKSTDPGADDPKIVFLAEESTFGRGVSDLLAIPAQSPRGNEHLVEPPKERTGRTECAKDSTLWRMFVRNTRVASFSQNISAIRAEQSRADQRANELLREILQSQSPLLKLDLSTLDESVDRPPVYHRSLSSRSDELMLYGTFNALSVWVRPAIVAIVATDVRDRLFLLNEVRKSLPTALPVLLEMDYLTAHPDYRKISRGSIVIPNGETLLCLDKQYKGIERCGGPEKIYLSFPSDYAANMFRAIFHLVSGNDPADTPPGGRKGLGDQNPFEWPDDEENAANDAPNKPQPWVTTLAGFQKISESYPSSRLLAADSRLSLEKPTYSFFLLLGISVIIVSIWLGLYCRNYLVLMSPLRNANPIHGIKEDTACTESAKGEPTTYDEVALRKRSRWIAFPLLTAGGIVTLMALGQLGRIYGWLEPPGRGQGYTWYSLQDFALPWWNWDLAHGTDTLALACLYILYLCISILAFWRLYLWGRHCYTYMNSLDTDSEEAGTAKRHNQHPYLRIVGFFFLFFLFMVVLFFVWSRGVPSAVEPAWPSIAVSLSLLGLGAVFLAVLWTEARSWTMLAQTLTPTIEMLRRSAHRPEILKDDDAEFRWPSPVLLNELPRSPFSLHFRERDLTALNRESTEVWADHTREFLRGGWSFSPKSGYTFERWQARLVAEMRCAAVAVRSAAWCGILAPIIVLLTMSVYPPFDQRLLTTASVTLIVIGFAMTIYIALRLEQHPLLGRMFTQHGDKLTIGGAFGALWGKLAAASIILIPVLFPDFLDWVHGLLQSINSLR